MAPAFRVGNGEGNGRGMGIARLLDAESIGVQRPRLAGQQDGQRNRRKEVNVRSHNGVGLRLMLPRPRIQVEIGWVFEWGQLWSGKNIFNRVVDCRLRRAPYPPLLGGNKKEAGSLLRPLI